jgi:UDP-glucose 4-epimerase
MKHSQYGVANWFVRLALNGQTIELFGDGRIRRDFLYVDDCVEAMLLCALCDDARGQILNVGIDRPADFRELAETLIEVCGSGNWKFAPFSEERKAQEPGDFYSDIRKIRSVVGWSPTTSLRTGLEATVDFYRKYREHYWTAEAPRAVTSDRAMKRAA